MKNNNQFIQFQGVMDRFISKIALQPNGCWNWTAGIRGTYPVFWYKGKNLGAHRFCYMACNTDDMTGMDVHHKCENEICVNPAHLELLSELKHSLITMGYLGYVNRVKTHCPMGHDYDETNTEIYDGRRFCKMCIRLKRLDNMKRNGHRKSEYPGVYWSRANGKWRARIRVNGRDKHLGTFESEIEAARAYGAKAMDLSRSQGLLNIL